MKKLILAAAFVSFTSIVSAQKNYRCLVTFKDKANSSYTLEKPLDYLSKKAVDRREKFKIPVDSTDMPITQSYVKGVEKCNMEFVCSVKWFNAMIGKTPDTSNFAQIRSLPYVKSIEIVGEVSAKRSVIGNSAKKSFSSDSKYSESDLSPALDYGSAASQINMVKGDIMHDEGYRGQGVTIAILDAGFLSANDTIVTALKPLFESNRIKATWNFPDNSPEVYKLSSGSHGTNVLSIIGAFENGDMIGVAPLADFILLRTEDAANEYIVEEYFWAAGAAFADSAGADVINSSLGYTEFDTASQNHTYKDMDGKTCPASIAANMAYKKGVVVVCSAGNEGEKPWRRIASPSDAEGVLAIAAVDELGDKAGFSSVGPSADKRVKPDVAALGFGTTVVNTNGSIVKGSGTSFSGPIIAGMAACLIQANPDVDNTAILNAIRRSSSQYDNPDSLLGYGIPNFNIANIMLKEYKLDKTTINGIVNTFPNPFTDEITVLFYSEKDQSASVCVFDTTGKQLYKEDRQMRSGGYYTFNIKDLGKLKSGTYTVSVMTSKEAYSRGILKQ